MIERIQRQLAVESARSAAEVAERREDNILDQYKLPDEEIERRTIMLITDTEVKMPHNGINHYHAAYEEEEGHVGELVKEIRPRPVPPRKKRTPEVKKEPAKRKRGERKSQVHITDTSDAPMIVGRGGEPRRICDESMRALAKKRKLGKQGYPLDISRMQGVDTIDDEEYEVCSVLRLPPTKYREVSGILIEHGKNGPYNKSRAQKLLSIDVNKTGQLFDYLYKSNRMRFKKERK
ncbi:MAG: uncharacterized protein A8A55_0147 [Amphiamblys sp. WSBS2006]|nr:MAG: uncharacterized protein A8A55_0147 [Amphiamblys sp. WSBS2006]